MAWLTLALVACGDDDRGFDSGVGDSGGVDTSVGMDSGPTPDTGGSDVGGMGDSGPMVDSGGGVDAALPDAGPMPDGGGSDGLLPDVGLGTMCTMTDECAEGEECCMIGGFGLCMASCPF